MSTVRDEYLNAYRSLKLTRDGEGILVAQIHTDGGPLTFTAQDHTDFVDAFSRIAQDRANTIVILTGSGGDFLPGIDFASFGNVADPSVLSHHYARDDARRRVIVAVEGPFQTSEILAVIERQRAEDTWSYGMLADLRRMTGLPTLADLRELLDGAKAGPVAEGRRGPVAFLATEPSLYARFCTYEALDRHRFL
jgi:hypothetical protein